MYRAISSVSRQKRKQITRKKNNEKPAIKGVKQREGGGQNTIHAIPQTTQKKTGEEPGGSRGPRENMTHTHQGGYESALAESKEWPRIIR